MKSRGQLSAQKEFPVNREISYRWRDRGADEMFWNVFENLFFREVLHVAKLREREIKITRNFVFMVNKNF